MASDKIIGYVNGRSCAILGLGVSNLPIAELLHSKGIRLFIYDKNPPEAIGERAIRLAGEGVDFFSEKETYSEILGELIIRSPGIRPDREGILRAVARGAEVIGEIELFAYLTDADTFAITGSDGKTTSTTLAGKFLESQAGRRTDSRIYVGGNIGTPLLTLCEEMTERDFAVLELSSFQLMSVKKSPRHVAITNVSPNHLDWHTDMNEYIAAKTNIIGENTKRLVTNAEYPTTLDIAKRFGDRVEELYLFSSEKHSFEEFERSLGFAPTLAFFEKDGHILSSDGRTETNLLDISLINLPGKHNVENFMTAIALTLGVADTEDFATVAKGFFGVEHRLEFVREREGVKFYNSSIDSSPSRTAAALSAMTGKSLVLICGGYDKNLDYAPLGKAICCHGGVRSVILTGATADKIRRAIEEFSENNGIPKPRLIEAETFDGAVKLSAMLAKSGDHVLLTPASASFDSFKNFMERGNRFKEIVNLI
ncbi:MAG: UDP-N-acetylmuramoyl-L-alanine--D-glutamate ligase [Clostridia bacterium]|nr:UDP-N-acetylmuramoyl-L-alanine--D-glutamate ligase [Clostridia bacterium]